MRDETGRSTRRAPRVAAGRGRRMAWLAWAAALTMLARGASLAAAQGSPVVSLTVQRSKPAIRVGGTSAFLALAELADGTTGVDVTASVTWTSSAPAVATLSGNVATGAGAGIATIVATDPASGVQSAPAAGQLRVVASLSSVRVTPAKRVLPIKRSTRYRAMGTFEDGIVIDITADADLILSQPAVGTLEPNGRFRALAPGTSVVRAVDRATGIASAASGGNGQVEVVGKLEALAVTPASLAVPVGAASAFKARASFAGYCQQYTYTRRIAWSSSAPAIASVDSEGKVTCLADGAVTISVRDRASPISSTASNADARVVCGGTVVAIEVSPLHWTVAIGEKRELRALYRFADGSSADGTRNVQWSSSDPAIVAIGRDGDAGAGQGLAPGAVTISAFDPLRNLGSGDPGGRSGTLEVASSLASFVLQPGGATGVLTGLVGSTIKFNARAGYDRGPARFVNKLSSWSSSNPQVVGLHDGSACYVEGTARLLAPGISEVAATYPGSGGPFEPLTAVVEVQVISSTPVPTPSPTPSSYGSASQAFLALPSGLLE